MIGFVTALPFEADALLDAGHRRGDGKPLIAQGAGRAAAQEAAQTLLDHGAQALVSFGVCGALAEDLTCGDLVLADRIVTPVGEVTACDDVCVADTARRLQPHITPRTGAIVQADQVVGSAADKAALAQRTGALAVDMESLAVAQVARAAGKRWVALRVVLDDADDAIPPAAAAGFKPGGGINYPALLGALIRRPGDLPALIRLKSRRDYAAEQLEALALLALPHFGLV